jgi:hypothetical protein
MNMSVEEEISTASFGDNTEGGEGISRIGVSDKRSILRRKKATEFY